MGIGGLTLASSISATVNMALLYAALRRRLGSLGGRRVLAAAAPMGASAALMGGLAFAYDRWVLEPRAFHGAALEGALLALGIAACVGVYFAACFWFRIEEARKIWSWRRKSSSLNT